MSNLATHARKELELAGLFDEDSDYGGMLADGTMKLIVCFAAEGHSGMSASMAVDIFSKLAKFEPLTPLTGNDDEWANPTGSGLLQNKRCSNVFKDKNGRAYDIDGRVFRDPNGSSYTGAGSSVDITFPYTPKTEYVDVPAGSDDDSVL